MVEDEGGPDNEGNVPATAGYVAATTKSVSGTIAASVFAIVGVGGPFAARVLASK